MSSSISEHSLYKTIPTELLKLVVISKAINELQNLPASTPHLSNFLPIALPYHINSIYPYFTHIFSSSHTQATIKIYLDLSAKF